jgi:hypothetical protein
MASGQANMSALREEPEAAIDLYWLPLGAGGHSVRLNGKVFEAVAARLSHRGTCDLYHSALIVHVPEGRFVIEQAPVRKNGEARGVVAEGPVGSRAAGRVRLFRYEVRRWRDGVIPDVEEAVESPKRISKDADVARRVLALVPDVPRVAWGRDELGADEMLELQLAHLVGPRPERNRRREDSDASTWASAGMARGHRRRPTPGRDARRIARRLGGA